ncbi:MAG TPA: ferrochelatase, partial [Thermomonas sp.]|nr:ferrochelatase [Thermomonas sp.]
QVLVRTAMRYGNPSVASVLDELKAENATRVLVLPLYPQYAAATTASVNDAVMAYNNKREVFPSSIFAGMFNFAAANLLEIPADRQSDVRAAPQVKF